MRFDLKKFGEQAKGREGKVTGLYMHIQEMQTGAQYRENWVL